MLNDHDAAINLLAGAAEEIVLDKDLDRVEAEIGRLRHQVMRHAEAGSDDPALTRFIWATAMTAPELATAACADALRRLGYDSFARALETAAWSGWPIRSRCNATIHTLRTVLRQALASHLSYQLSAQLPPHQVHAAIAWTQAVLWINSTSPEHNFAPYDRARVAQYIAGESTSNHESQGEVLGVAEAYRTAERAIYQRTGGHYCVRCGGIVDNETFGKLTVDDRGAHYFCNRSGDSADTAADAFHWFL